MKSNRIKKFVWLGIIILTLNSCKINKQVVREADLSMPSNYLIPSDSSNIAVINYKGFFKDSYLVKLIDTALQNNQELNIFLKEMEVLKNESNARKGEYLPFVNVGADVGVEKTGRYTRNGAVEDQLKVKDGQAFPDPLGDFRFGAVVSWEVDIWKKLRNSQKVAVNNYLASVEGQNFLKTNLIAEIANSYYELLSLDNLLIIINQNIEIQSKSLSVVKQQKKAAKVSQLAVNRFKAQLLHTANMQYMVKQKIIATENRINFLTARFPQPIERTSINFMDIAINSLNTGVPGQLLASRPDIRQAEFKLAATKLNVKVARANFYPSLSIRAGIGFQAFNATNLIRPESILYNLAGGLMAPLVNKKAIKATYASANAKQLQAVYNYEKTILKAYIDVQNQLAKVTNFSASLDTKSQEVKILQKSIKVANLLFKSARADYAEVLLTQREALEAKLDLVEIKTKTLLSQVSVYRSLGGGF